MVADAREKLNPALSGKVFSLTDEQRAELRALVNRVAANREPPDEEPTPRPVHPSGFFWRGVVMVGPDGERLRFNTLQKLRAYLFDKETTP